MNRVHDAASAARVLAGRLEPLTRVALEREIALLTSGEFDLTDHTFILLVEPGDTEGEIDDELWFSPLVDQTDGARYGQPGFVPSWDLLTLDGGVFRCVFTFGGTHATIVLAPDVAGVLPELRACFHDFIAK